MVGDHLLRQDQICLQQRLGGVFHRDPRHPHIAASSVGSVELLMVCRPHETSLRRSPESS